MALAPSSGWLKPALLLVVWVLSFVVHAGRVDSVSVSHENKQYSVAVSAWVDLKQPDLMALLTDYPRVSKVNESIQSVEILPAPAANITRLKAQLKICVWFYCRQLTQVQDMNLLGAGHLQAVMLPEPSDYKYGLANWRVISEGQGSRLLFDVTVEPDFWVPPVVGPAIIKRKLKQEAVETVIGIESLAADE